MKHLLKHDNTTMCNLIVTPKVQLTSEIVECDCVQCQRNEAEMMAIEVEVRYSMFKLMKPALQAALKKDRN